MQLGIFARTFAGSGPVPVLAAVRAAGYSLTQYNMVCSGLPAMPDVIPDETMAALSAAAAQGGVEILAMSATYNMIHPDPAVREAGHARLETLAAASRGVTGLLTLCTGTRDAEDQWRAHPDNETPEAWRDLLASMERAVSIAERHDLDLGIEPEFANVVSSAQRARRLIEEIASPRLKIVLDPANLFEAASQGDQRRIVASSIETLADRIVMAHAKDRTPEGAFTTAGTGVLDYPHFLSCLRSAGFDGPIVTHGLTAAEAPAVAAFLRAALADAGVSVTP
jgi:sugar phosphate isomerase/epimerase